MINRKEIFEKYIEEVTSFSNIEGNKNTDLPDGRLKEDSINYFVEDDNFKQYINFALGKKIDKEKLKEPIQGGEYSRREILLSLGVLTNEEVDGNWETQKKFWNLNSINTKRNEGFAIFMITSPKNITDPKNDLSKNYDNYVSEDKSEVKYIFKPKGKKIDNVNYEIRDSISMSKKVKIFKEIGKKRNSKNLFEYLGEYSIISFDVIEKCFKLLKNDFQYETSNLEDMSNLYSENEKEINRSFDEIVGKMKISENEKLALVKLRTSQGKIRTDALEKYVEGEFVDVKHEKTLIASHIKPWRYSSDDEKNDVDNILLLDALTDSLFDRGLITFDEFGYLKISKKLNSEIIKNSDNELMSFLNNGKKISMNKARQSYMKYHEENIFKDNEK